MRRTSRLTTVLLLLVAVLVTGLLPAAGSWSCPDGTACVYTAERGFHCQGDACRLACCAGAKPADGCGRCAHGGVPGVATAAGAGQRAITGMAHCQYREAPQGERVWVAAHAAPALDWHPVATLPQPPAPPVLTPLFARLAPIRGSPPRARAVVPSSPRAPPGSDCA